MRFPGFLVIAHRGASGSEIENTLPAFRRAVREGADFAETDLRLTADGEVVLFHDDDLRRLARRPGAVEGQALRALPPLIRRGGSGRGRIPMLGEAFDACPALRFFLELKTTRGNGEALVAATLSAVDTARASTRVAFLGFDPGALERVRRALPSAVLGRNLEGPLPRRLEAWCARLRPRFLGLSADRATASRIRHLTTPRRGVLVFTVNDPGEALRLRRAGAAGVFTDWPGRLLRSL